VLRRIYFGSAGVLAIVILAIVVSPRAPPGGVVNAPANPIYSSFYLGATLMAVLMFLSALGAVGAVAGLTVTASTHVRVIQE
jgi:hypothetical protein